MLHLEILILMGKENVYKVILRSRLRSQTHNRSFLHVLYRDRSFILHVIKKYNFVAEEMKKISMLSSFCSPRKFYLSYSHDLLILSLMKFQEEMDLLQLWMRICSSALGSTKTRCFPLTRRYTKLRKISTKCLPTPTRIRDHGCCTGLDNY